MSAEFEELGRYVADFSFLDKALRLLCAALVVPPGADDLARTRAEIVASEVDLSRLIRVINRLVNDSHTSTTDTVDGRENHVQTAWKRIKGDIHEEINWRNDVAHSWWPLAWTDDGIELQHHRRGEVKKIAAADISQHRRRLQQALFASLKLLAVVDPTVEVDAVVRSPPTTGR